MFIYLRIIIILILIFFYLRFCNLFLLIYCTIYSYWRQGEGGQPGVIWYGELANANTYNRISFKDLLWGQSSLERKKFFFCAQPDMWADSRVDTRAARHVSRYKGSSNPLQGGTSRVIRIGVQEQKGNWSSDIFFSEWIFCEYWFNIYAAYSSSVCNPLQSPLTY